MFELSLSLIFTITKEFKENNFPVLITGDFNADVNRSNKFDIILKNYLKDHCFNLLDNLNNKNTFTFKSALINNSYHLSNLDHFILCQSMIPKTMTKLEFKILEDIANMSDHNAINLKFLILKSKPKHES